MNHLKLIHEYLRDRSSLKDIPPSGHPFITISRQAGAGGHLLAYVLMTDFLKFKDGELFQGWHVFDKDLCEIVAEDPSLQNSMESLVTERYKPALREFIDGLLTGDSSQYRHYKKTFEVVRVLALLGKVIIVGRAGACVTRDMPRGIHIRLAAPEPTRIRWMMKKLQIEKNKAADLVNEQDRDRRRMLRTFFDKDIDDPVLYDAVWNTERTSPHEISAAVIEMMRFRAQKQCEGQ